MSTRTALIRSTQVLVDLLVLAVAFALAFFLRFEGQIPAEMLDRLRVTAAQVVALHYAALWVIGVPRYVWRYVGLREASRILLATGLATSALVAARWVAPSLPIEAQRYTLIPFGVIALDFTLAFLGVAGARALRRLLAERADSGSRSSPASGVRRTVVIGAGKSGLSVAKEIACRPELGMVAIAFLDDDPTKRGTLVHGIPVLGPVEALAELAPKLAAELVLISVSNARGQTVRRIAQGCAQADLPVKIVPVLHELVGGQIDLNGMRDVAIEDLLGRAPVRLDQETIAAQVRGQVVLVTGAGGSIGSELCRQLCRFEPALLVLVERAENALFEIHRELAERSEAPSTAPCIGDVGDSSRMRQLLRRYHPSMVFHAAAHKHVPMMEDNPLEAIKNNVFGTQILADTAVECGVSKFVLISTDKAVRPSSVMGATKRAAELYIQAIAQGSSTCLVTVRFGNVLGSAGSVVPIFKRQIAAGGPITVTDPKMTRYFMTIPEASQLVLQAASMGEGGEIFILDMGEPVNILDLAKDLIRLCGLSENEVEISITGPRPGEKLVEELCLGAEEARTTSHHKIFVGHGGSASLECIRSTFERLHAAVSAADETQALAILGSLVQSDAAAAPQLPHSGETRATALQQLALPRTQTGGELAAVLMRSRG